MENKPTIRTEHSIHPRVQSGELVGRSYRPRPKQSQPSSGRMIQRKRDFKPMGTIPVSRPFRLGPNSPGDNSALQVWDETGSQIL